VTQSAPPPEVTSGPVLFARYAYPPNALGYCGPGDPAALLQAASHDGPADHLAHLAVQFEGAWPYLELIAGVNSIRDPLDRRVVEAYWIGNELALRVPARVLASSLDERFSYRVGPRSSDLVASALCGGVAQHSLHVFGVYPWLGMLRAGSEGVPLEVMNNCRIRWGRVEEVTGDLVRVTSQALEFRGSRLRLGPERFEVVRQSLDGMGMVDALIVGDVVSLHWDWVCDRLTPQSLSWLRFSTQRNLSAVNSQSAPGPAIVCDA